MEYIDPVLLTARVDDPSHFVFIAETWERELKPIKKARWKHDAEMYSAGNVIKCPNHYELKQGHFLVFIQTEQPKGGFHAAHLYAVCKELAEVTGQVKATMTDEGLTLEAVDSKARFFLKYRAVNVSDTIHHAVLGYHS
jgi:hypothetical protein